MTIITIPATIIAYVFGLHTVYIAQVIFVCGNFRTFRIEEQHTKRNYSTAIDSTSLS